MRVQIYEPEGGWLLLLCAGNAEGQTRMIQRRHA